MNVEYINPFVKATTKVFRTMLGCELRRQELSRKRNLQPYQEVSGVIEFYGEANGIVVLGVSREIAVRAAGILLRFRKETVNEMVRDALERLTNIIANYASEDLQRLNLRIGTPRVVVGRNHLLPLDNGGVPIDIVFESEWGCVVVEMSLLEHRESKAMA